MDIQAQILEKKQEMEVLQKQMRALNQKHVEGLYPGRCFQYCIDHGLGTQEDMALLSETEVRAKAEGAHFAAVARKTVWPCGNDECQGWDSKGDTCACGAKKFYWMYEETLSLANSVILQSPAASVAEQ